MNLLRCLVVLLALLLLAEAGQAADAKRPPNIVLILADDKYYNPAVEGRNHRENL